MHSVASGLKDSHLLGIKVKKYPNIYIFIYYPKGIRASWAFCSFRVESQSLTKYKSKNIGGHHAYFVALGFKGNHSLSMKGMKHVINSVYNNFIMS